jgi:hypothetical protein
MLGALHAVAVEHDFLPPKNPVPRWVEQCFTREHERRKLAVLEGGRGGADAGPRHADAGAEKTADLDLSSTLALPRSNRQRRLLALALVAISLLAIGLSLTFSPALSRRSWTSPAPEAPPNARAGVQR